MELKIGRYLVHKVDGASKNIKTKYHTFVIGNKEREQYWFDEERKGKEWILKCQRIYEQGGIVTSAIDAYPEQMFKSIHDGGLELGGRNANAKHIEYLENWCGNFDFVSECTLQITNSLVAGKGICDLVEQRSAIGFMHCRNPVQFETVLDTQGRIVEYFQILKAKLGGRDDKKPVKAEFTWDLQLMPSNTPEWGRSLIASAYDEIIRDVKTADGTTKGIWRHGTKKYNITVDDDNYEVSDDDIKKITEEFRNIDSMSEFVHRKSMTIEELDAGGVPVNEYNMVSISRLCTAIGVPEEVLGLGRGSTEATANVRLRAFYDKIAAMQTRFNYSLWSQVFKPVLAQAFPEDDIQPVFVKFGFVDVDGMLKKFEAAAKMQGSRDPFEVYHRDEIRAITGHGKYDEVPEAKADEEMDIDDAMMEGYYGKKQDDGTVPE